MSFGKIPQGREGARSARPTWSRCARWSRPPRASRATATAPGPILIDVREKDEWTEGFIPGARWIPRGFLELRIEDQVPERSSEIILYCAGGTRSALAARSLAELGYTNVKSMAGGFTAWKRAGLPFERPFVMTQEQSLRYARHTMLPEVGEAGQVKLLKSKVLCLGAGGLGSPSGLYLAAAGVGTMGFVDDDVVDASNLQRQILHATDRVGMPKVESAQIAIAQAQPRRQGDRAPDAPVVGERAGHHQGLRRHRRRRRQLPDPLPAQRRGAEAGQAGGPRQHLPLRGAGDVVHPRRGARATAASIRRRRRPTWRRRARRRACWACCAA